MEIRDEQFQSMCGTTQGDQSILKPYNDGGTDQHNVDSNIDVTSFVTRIWIEKKFELYWTCILLSLGSFVIITIANMNWMFTMCQA